MSMTTVLVIHMAPEAEAWRVEQSAQRREVQVARSKRILILWEKFTSLLSGFPLT